MSNFFRNGILVVIRIRRNLALYMKKIAFITPPEVEYAFELTGVRQYVSREEEAEITLLNTLKESETGLIVIDERLLRGLTEERLKEIEKSWGGIILVLPSPERPEVEVEDFAARLIKRAIGYHVKLKI